MLDCTYSMKGYVGKIINDFPIFYLMLKWGADPGFGKGGGDRRLAEGP